MGPDPVRERLPPTLSNPGMVTCQAARHRAVRVTPAFTHPGDCLLAGWGVAGAGSNSVDTFLAVGQ